jgi:hypothetical protein
MAIDTTSGVALHLSIFSEQNPTVATDIAYVCIHEQIGDDYAECEARIIELHEALPDSIWFKRMFPHRRGDQWHRSNGSDLEHAFQTLDQQLHPWSPEEPTQFGNFWLLWSDGITSAIEWDPDRGAAYVDADDVPEDDRWWPERGRVQYRVRNLPNKRRWDETREDYPLSCSTGLDIE